MFNTLSKPFFHELVVKPQPLHAGIAYLQKEGDTARQLNRIG
jgi:hypothetical protein